MKRKTKKFLRIVFTALVLVVAPYSAMYVYINERGRDMLVDMLQKKTGSEVALQSMSFSFPLRLTLADLKMEGLTVGQAVIDLGVGNPFSSTLVLNKLYLNGASFLIDENTVFPSGKTDSSAAQEVIHAGFVPAGKKKVNIMIKEIVLNKCAVVLQKSNVQPPLDLRIEGITGVIRDFHYPEVERVYVNLNSGISVNKFLQENVLHLKGWVDWPAKGMDVVLKIDNIDYFIFDPYYPPFWKTKNLELKEARVSVDAALKAENDDLLMDYRIIFDKAVFVDNPEDPARVKNYQTVLNLFTHDGKPEIRLRHTTKMSAPTFKVTFIGEGLLDQLKAIDEEKSKDTLNYYMNKSKDLVESGVDKVKALTVDPPVRAIHSLFEEFLKSVTRVFNIKPKVEENYADDISEGE